MRLCVLNYSGNVGKSTLAKHLLAPRLNDCEMLNVESINADDSDDEAIRGRRFRELTEMLDLCNCAVVDVGSSNVEDYLIGMKEFRGAHEDYDAFIVPTTPPKKQQRDTVSTISALAQMGVEPQRIRIILNWVDHGEEPHQVFASLIAWTKEQKRCPVPRAVVGYNELFSLLRDSGRTIAQLLADDTDYRGAMRATSDADEKLRLSRALAMRRLAIGVQEDLDAAWEALWEEAA
jgi:hypothetical protein